MCREVTDVKAVSLVSYIDLIQLLSNFTGLGRTLTSLPSPEAPAPSGRQHSSCVRAETVTYCSRHHDRSGGSVQLSAAYVKGLVKVLQMFDREKSESELLLLPSRFSYTRNFQGMCEDLASLSSLIPHASLLRMQ